MIDTSQRMTGITLIDEKLLPAAEGLAPSTALTVVHRALDKNPLCSSFISDSRIPLENITWWITYGRRAASRIHSKDPMNTNAQARMKIATGQRVSLGLRKHHENRAHGKGHQGEQPLRHEILNRRRGSFDQDVDGRRKNPGIPEPKGNASQNGDKNPLG